ncbi:MAG: MFS transporter [Paracoccaceae bacterium]
MSRMRAGFTGKELVLILACLTIVATCYGLARYAYGLFIPLFRQDLGLGDAQLAFTASAFYGSYFLVALLAISQAHRLTPRVSIALGGVAAATGMLIVAGAGSLPMLLVGVSLAGISPALAYMPLSKVIEAAVAGPRQSLAYGIVNTGTSLGVALSGPVAIFWGQGWRGAWVAFAAFGLLSTFFCLSRIAPAPAKVAGQPAIGEKSATGLSDLRVPGGALLQLFSFLIGVACSVYWTFSADLVAATTPGWEVERIFWITVGLAGFGGALVGPLVGWLGLLPATSVFALMVGGASLALAHGAGYSGALLSGALFGAAFNLLSASLGLWAMQIYRGRSSAGFGLTFLTLSAGQFVGPLVVGGLAGRVGLTEIYLWAALAMLILAALAPLILGGAKQRSRLWDCWRKRVR